MNIKKMFIRYWPALAIAILILLSVYVRTVDYRWPYLRNIDSYTFAREIERIVEYGYLPAVDPLSLAPDFYNISREGAGISFGLFPYQNLGAYGFLLTKIFIPDLDLFTYLIYFPAVLFSLAAIPAYYIGKYLYDRRAGLLTAFFVLFDISNVQRTLGGDPDSDAIVIMMPLVVMTLFLATYKYLNTSEKIGKKGLLLSFITGVSLILWRHTWVGYWYIVWLILGFLVVKTLVTFLSKKDVKETLLEEKNIWIGFGIIMATFIILNLPFSGGLGDLQTAITGPLEFQQIKSEEESIFPNVYVSVAELQASGDFLSVIRRIIPVSGFAALFSPFLLMVYGLAYLTFSYITTRKHADTTILLLIWFLGPFLATIVAVRFATLFSAPIAIGSAIFLAKLIRLSTGEDKNLGD
jgi:asparagine N-glycosylation enzyme membrane subunit Stt3